MRPSRIASLISGRRLDWCLVGLALVASVLPIGALRPWTNDVARIVLVPLVPVTHLGMYLRDRIRPPQLGFDPRAPETIRLEAELEDARALYERARLESQALRDSLAALRAVSSRLDGVDARLVEATVVMTDPARSGGAVRVNAGARHGAVPGAAVFAEGDIFVGMVSDDISPFASAVVPSTKLGGIGCRILPAEGSDPARPIQQYAGAVLKPSASGRWTAEVASTGELAVGMVARLADERFPRSALGTRVGRVVAVAPVEQVPLARRIEVEPLVDLAELRSVVISTEGARP